MLILPIVNKNRIMNVQLRLKNAKKIRTNVKYDDAGEADIIVNSEKFSESAFYNTKSENAPVEFVRSKSINYPRNYLITTKERSNKPLYDLYEVGQPLSKVNDGLDILYSKALTDMRQEVPGNRRGRYVSFKDLGIDEEFTEEKISTLQRIVKEERDQSKWPKLFLEADVMSLKDTIDFINMFDAKIIKDTTIPEDSLDDVLKGLEVINTRDSRNLRKYYKNALDNQDTYAKLSYVNHLIYNEPFIIKTKNSKNKQLVKSKESDYNVN